VSPPLGSIRIDGELWSSWYALPTTSEATTPVLGRYSAIVIVPCQLIHPTYVTPPSSTARGSPNQHQEPSPSVVTAGAGVVERAARARAETIAARATALTENAATAVMSSSARFGISRMRKRRWPGLSATAASGKSARIQSAIVAVTSAWH
jgi:hypothetical protein